MRVKCVFCLELDAEGHDPENWPEGAVSGHAECRERFMSAMNEAVARQDLSALEGVDFKDPLLMHTLYLRLTRLPALSDAPSQ